MQSTIRVTRMLPVSGASDYDCADVADSCALVLTDWSRDRRVIAPLSFDPAAGPGTTLAVAPGAGLTDGQQVSVAGSGWPAGAYLEIYACATGETAVPPWTDFDDLRCDDELTTSLPAAPDGTFATSMVISADVDGLDCRTNACLLYAIGPSSFRATSTRLEFAP